MPTFSKTQHCPYIPIRNQNSALKQCLLTISKARMPLSPALDRVGLAWSFPLRHISHTLFKDGQLTDPKASPYALLSSSLRGAAPS